MISSRQRRLNLFNHIQHEEQFLSAVSPVADATRAFFAIIPWVENPRLQSQSRYAIKLYDQAIKLGQIGVFQDAMNYNSATSHPVTLRRANPQSPLVATPNKLVYKGSMPTLFRTQLR